MISNKTFSILAKYINILYYFRIIPIRAITTGKVGKLAFDSNRETSYKLISLGCLIVLLVTISIAGINGMYSVQLKISDRIFLFACTAIMIPLLGTLIFHLFKLDEFHHLANATLAMYSEIRGVLVSSSGKKHYKDGLETPITIGVIVVLSAQILVLPGLILAFFTDNPLSATIKIVENYTEDLHRKINIPHNTLRIKLTQLVIAILIAIANIVSSAHVALALFFGTLYVNTMTNTLATLSKKYECGRQILRLLKNEAQLFYRSLTLGSYSVNRFYSSYVVLGYYVGTAVIINLTLVLLAVRLPLLSIVTIGLINAVAIVGIFCILYGSVKMRVTSNELISLALEHCEKSSDPIGIGKRYWKSCRPILFNFGELFAPETYEFLLENWSYIMQNVADLLIGLNV